MGVTVTFMAILELVREGLIDIVQAEPYAPLHVRAAAPARRLRVVADNDEPRSSEALTSEPAGEPAAAGSDSGTDSGEEDATSE